MTELKQLIAERELLTGKIVAAAKEEFGAAIAGLFEAFPELENFAWLQYSHEYDDGEYPWSIQTNVAIDDDGYINMYANSTQRGYSDVSPRQSEVLEQWKKFPEWLLLELFGEDNYVICYPDRVERIEYYGN